MLSEFGLLALASVAGLVIGYVLFRKRLETGVGRILAGGKSCPKCHEGLMEPHFSWWRYGFAFMLPPGIVYVLGRANREVCSKCGFSRSPSKSQGFVTRLPLTARLGPSVWLAFCVYGLIGGAALLWWFS
jgi:hypothetical protein